MALVEYDDVIDDEPNIQETKSHCRDYEEIHRSDPVLVIPKKGHPSLLHAGIGCPLGKIARDGCETDGEPEPLELGVDLSRTPVVLAGQPTNERLQLRGNRRPPRDHALR